MKKPVIIAHRGASAYAPENTMISFNKAVEMDAGGIELDVQLSKDGHVVVIHDEQIDRTSNGKGWVKDLTLEELKAYDFGGWFSKEYKDERISTLDEILSRFKSWHGIINIEIKNGLVIYPDIEKKVVEVVKRYNAQNRTIISSFNHYSLMRVKEFLPQVRIGLLYVADLINPWQYAKNLGVYAIHPLFYSLTSDIVSDSIANGIKINTYTVDKPETIKSLAVMGADGIITNVPDVASKALENI